jgi:hypothetical protein
VEIEVAPGVAVVDAPNGARLRGPAEAISATLQRLRVLRDVDEGTTAQLGPWTLLVSDYVPNELPPRTISLPGRAWNIAASVLSDAAFGDYLQNPFDFRDVAYLDPPPIRDLGVEVTDAS